MTTRSSDVNLVIRARTEGEKAIAGLGDILENLFDDARSGSDDIATLGKTIGALDKAAASIAGSMDKAGAAIDRQRASINENNAAYAALLQQQAEAQRVLSKFGDQANKAFVGPRTKEFTEQYAGVRAEVDRLGASISNLFAKIGQQNAQLNGTQSSLLKLSATSSAVAHGQAEAASRIELTTQALREQAAAGDRVTTGKGGLFGLKPYELTNLGYQINDVATQLASGTSLTQTLGQQGGQILQIFPRITSAIVGAFKNPAFLGAAAVLGGIIVALTEAGDQAERLRKFSAGLAFKPDGASYDASALTKQAAALERLGASAKDADAAINALVDQGIAPDAMIGLGRAAQETAVRLGQSLPDAVRAAAEAFSGGYDAVAKFDDKLDFLTASEREHIRALFEAGNAEAARTEARLAYQRMEDGIAAKSRGPWGDAARSLGNAWSALVKFIADSVPIKATIAVLDGLAVAVKGVGDAITAALGSDKPQASSAGAANIARVQEQIRTLKASIANYESAIAKKSPVSGTLSVLAAHARQELATAQAELAKLEKSAPDTLSSDPNSPAAKQRADDLASINREDELQRLRAAGQSRILSAAEQARRAELAGQEAAKGASDAVVAAALKRKAVAQETAKIEQETDARSKAAAAEARRLATPREQAKLIIRAAEGFRSRAYTDSDGRPRVGYGSDTVTRTDGSIGRAAANSTVDREGAERDLDRRVGDVFEYLKTKLGDRLEKFTSTQQGVLASIVYNYGKLPESILKALRFGSNQDIADAIRARGDDRAHNLGPGANRDRRNMESDLFGRAAKVLGEDTPAIDADNEKNDKERQRRQNAFNESLAKEDSQHQGIIAALQAEAGLRGTALLAEQRKQAVDEAERARIQKGLDENRNLKDGETPVIVPPEEIERAKELAGALFDVQHAQDLLNAQIAGPQRDVEANREKVDLLKQQVDYLRSIGDIKGAADVDRQIVEANGVIAESINVVIAAYQNLGPALIAAGIVTDQQLKNLIAKLKQAKQSTQEWGKVAGIAGDQIAHAFASAAATAFTNFINKIAAGQNVFRAFGESVRELAANFIASIAQMILQLLAFAAAVTILRALGVPVPNGASIFDKKVGQNHTGGIAGGSAGGVQRSVSPMLFRNAMRYHNGGIAGIMPDEVPAILRRGEEVLTEGDPRHRANGGSTVGDGNGGGLRSLRIVNSFDPDETARQLITTKGGEKAILNLVKANKRAFQAALS